MIKSFRKSKRTSSSSSSPKRNISRVSSTSNSDAELILQSPKKVIKALYDYDPQGPGELKFKVGDFFHVLNISDDPKHKEAEENGWYEATNPMTHTKGMVPINYFEVFDRSRPTATTSNSNQSHQLQHQQLPHHHNNTANSHSNNNFQQNQPQQRNSNQTLYAVTLYEFKAEREDELDVLPGENLIICAHHDYEWFIAKPINRLGGPGLVPVAYVKIIDLMNPGQSSSTISSIDTTNREQVMKIISGFKIPTVEQWKDQTAKYQASSIALGTISRTKTPPSSSTSQFFDGKTTHSNRSSLISTSIIEASVDSYQLYHGRYQYLITAKLSNGKIRNLYRYYQDFYDLQVKLLEMFPYEAGKIENSKRIIPSIPGPLINVNDSISKLRREKLDIYLSQLIALPNHISKSEEVLNLFEILNNGFDKEIENTRRVSKPISQKSNSHQDRMSQYSNFGIQPRISDPSNSNESTTQRSRESSTINVNTSNTNNYNNNNIPSTSLTSSSPTDLEKSPKVKVKFYYEDDIFALLLPSNLRLQDLKTKLYKRLELDDLQQHQFQQPKTINSIKLFLKNDYENFCKDMNIVDSSIENLNFNQYGSKLIEFEIDDDLKFHEILYDKCKLIIVIV
ncbi:BEM1 [Candida pseudojiufengensis]|uniref:BEM1 n=1 Tax=Candida pseudojiufengensis TaxID=497109 RepID=UPI002224B33D|nr:BEM1 [Candida pseudojiufengensis]KAI5965747.1 BEM1 [Candida pseudojiufengensis]